MNAFSVTCPTPEAAILSVAGDWSIHDNQPSAVELDRLLEPGSSVRRVTFEGRALGRRDTALLSYLFAAAERCREREVTAELSGLPGDVRRLLDLASSGEAHAGHDAARRREPFVMRTGVAAIRQTKAFLGFLAFLGDSVIAVYRALRHRARFRGVDFGLAIQQCGAGALPIVSVISLLVGMIFSFVGAVQLKQFGADIYDANLVAVAMAREMAAVMTAVVLAGRTGAAFAAQIGAMQGNEEVDALSTLGISPIEFLVLPRLLALMLMMPLLCVYATAVGIFGGFVVAISTLDVTPTAYLLRTQEALRLTDLDIGLVKSAVFGALVAITGCLCGIRCGRSAEAVGAATTSAVVYGILAIIIADAVFAVVLNIVGL